MKTDEEILGLALKEYPTIKSHDIMPFERREGFLAGYKSAQSSMEAEINKWAPLAKISDSPETWLELYGQYQDMLTKEDVAAWYQEQFQMQCKLREEAEASIDRRANEKVEEWKKGAAKELKDISTHILALKDAGSIWKSEGIKIAINLLKPSEGENHE